VSEASRVRIETRQSSKGLADRL